LRCRRAPGAYSRCYSRAQPIEALTLEQVQDRTGLLERTAMRMLDDLRRAGLVDRQEVCFGDELEVQWTLTSVGRSYARDSIPPR
jgi:DNA-binding IclR family transcriptional regulator